MANTECGLRKSQNNITFYYHHVGLDETDDTDYSSCSSFNNYKQAVQQLKNGEDVELIMEQDSLQLTPLKEKINLALISNNYFGFEFPTTLNDLESLLDGQRSTVVIYTD